MYRSIVLCSGGIDSSLALALAHKWSPPALALFLYYGQRNAREELEAVGKVTQALGVDWRRLTVPGWILGHESAALLSGKPLRDAPPYEELIRTTEPSDAVVPFRNGVFLSIAASVAEQEGASVVYSGIFNEGGAAYPDTTDKFIYGMEIAIAHGTVNSVALSCPLRGMTKTQVVELAIAHGVNIDDTYSCHAGLVPPCGRCSACVKRDYALAHITPPTP